MGRKTRKRKSPSACAVAAVDENADPLSEAQKKKREKALTKVLKKEADLAIIIEVNKALFREAAAAQEEMTTEPDCKPVMEVSDDMKPGLNVGLLETPLPI